MQRSMINLAFGSTSTTLTELRMGLSLPCDIFKFEMKETEENLDRVSSKAFARDLRKGKMVAEDFLDFAKINKSSDLFDSQKSFFESLVTTEEEEVQHFGQSVNYVKFYTFGEEPDETSFMIGSKMFIGHNEDRNGIGRRRYCFIVCRETSKFFSWIKTKKVIRICHIPIHCPGPNSAPKELSIRKLFIEVNHRHVLLI